MIVKIQRSIAPFGMVLIYSIDHEVVAHGPLDPKVAELMGDRYKVFVEARVEDDELVIGEEVEEQPW